MWNSETWEECQFLGIWEKFLQLTCSEGLRTRRLLPKILTKDFQQNSVLQVWQDKGVSACELYLVESYPFFDFEP